jgi:dTDP-4-amino-4,6-dideoxygalactose transaminase
MISNIRKMKIPFLSFQPMQESIREEMINSFTEVYDSAWYVLGKKVEAFEQEYASYNSVSHCIGVSNGLDALVISLKTLHIGVGDEVIVPSNTFIASVLAVTYVGATPVFVEPDEKTYNINPVSIDRAITSKTKAIIAVHLYGQACDMTAISRIAEKHRLFIIEDNAQAHGASFNNKITGSWGHINATSFYPGKNLGALGDAGAITTNDQALADKARVFRNYGSQKKYYNQEAGFNMRLDELQAAFLSVKLKHIDKWTRQRQEIAEWYRQLLMGTGDIILPFIHSESTHVYHLFVITTHKRDELMKFLSEGNIQTQIHYPVPPHLQDCYKYLGFSKGDFPIAEKLAETCLSLPLYPGMSRPEVEFVADNIKRFFTNGF